MNRLAFAAGLLALASKPSGVDVPLLPATTFASVPPSVLSRLGVAEVRPHDEACRTVELGDLERARKLGCIYPVASPFRRVAGLAPSLISHLVELGEGRAELRPSSGTLALLVNGRTPFVFGSETALGVGRVCVPVAAFREAESNVALMKCTMTATALLKSQALVVVRLDASGARVVDTATTEFDSCLGDLEDGGGCRVIASGLRSTTRGLRLAGEVQTCDGNGRVPFLLGLVTKNVRARAAVERDPCGYLQQTLERSVRP